VTRDELPNPQAMSVELKVNGTVKQSSSTEDMIFGCAKIVSYCSQFMTLLPGDVIITGTPGGVGVARSPQEFLRAGDTVQLKIARLGEQTQRVRSAA
jgi:2-keto-4-pentenoate hydratase/2-oxohepta-3-ene-1,7-dioic acid hydratase in catechol pathway